MSKVELSKITSLTLYKDAYTEARRTSAIPQLRCVGKPCRLFQPEVVRCVSLGGVGTDVDWKCEADLPDSLRFGKVDVSCEGWSRPGDPYVLKGSCSLEYRLVQIPDALRGDATDSPRFDPRSYDWASIAFSVLWVAFLLFIAYSFFESCLRNANTRRPTAPRTPGGTSGGGGGGGGWFPGDYRDEPGAPPPPYSYTKPTDNSSATSGWRPGFWTGAAAGGLANHLLNRRRTPPQPSYDWERPANAAPRPRTSLFGGGSDPSCPSPFMGSVVVKDTLDRQFAMLDLSALIPTPCLPGSNTTNPTTTTTSTTRTTASPTSSAPGTSNSLCPGAGGLTKFRFFGVNEAGAEFGDNKIPGILGTDYTWPSPSSIDYFVGQGFNAFRIPFKLERLVPLSGGLAGSFDQTYLAALKNIVNYITNKGAYALVEPHNYMRYNNNIITNTNDFAAFWRSLASQFQSNNRVIFDIMNEPYGIDAQVVFNLNQAAVNAIRAAGATQQLITVEGTSWTGAHSWISSGNAAAFVNLKDPNNNIAIQMHQYLDSDSSGTSGTCVSSTIGAERLTAATNWLKQNNFKGFLGEMGAGSNPTCIAAVKGAMCHMQSSGVWLGFTWWAAGPWWGDYFTSIEPYNGASISQILPQALKPFL
ncbi:hypothetical protein D9619_004868 [Psilocybe cf. subviscida]|uniref:cellulase n=1 Tax=Psilocybe cf. subviscida TaxID=2480587 RepID=A0A8H5BSS0_9AGAR|nr:hypothetical protein D9619_004868 [Psilocybe cf. subviscida]